MATINEFLKSVGYHIYMVSADARYFAFVQEENYAVNVICLFDERMCISSLEQIQSFNNNLSEKLNYGRNKYIHILNIICGNNDYIITHSSVTGGEDWYIDTDRFELVVPPNAPEDFYGIKSGLASYIMQNGLIFETVEAVSEEAGLNRNMIEKVPARDGVPVRRNVKGDKKVYIPWVTAVIILINVVVYIAQRVFNLEPWEHLLFITNDILSIPAEWYRLLTYSIFHADISHIANNMLSMYLVASLLEKKAGRPFVIAMYFITGIGAGIFSVWYHDLIGDLYYGLGASGIVFGLEGALMSYMLMSQNMRSKMTIMIAASAFALMFLEPSGHVDTAGHVGGLVCGLLAGGIWCIVSSSRKNKRVSADKGSV